MSTTNLSECSDQTCEYLKVLDKEKFLESTKDYVIVDRISYYGDTNEFNKGIVIKSDKNNKYKIDSTIVYNVNSDKIFKVPSDPNITARILHVDICKSIDEFIKPEKRKYTKKTIKTKTAIGGKLTNEGLNYYNNKMTELCKDDPGGWEKVKIAIWFIRKERTQRKRSEEEAILNSAKKYGINSQILLSRYRSNKNYWIEATYK
jgi:hypothetical protein